MTRIPPSWPALWIGWPRASNQRRAPDDAERGLERLAARGALARCGLHRQRLPLLVQRRQVGAVVHQQPLVRRIGQDRLPLPVHHEHRVAHAAQDRGQARPLVPERRGGLLELHAARLQVVVRRVQLLDGRL
jgi:hypothetical protein